MKFTDLPLEATLLEDIQKLGYESCTPIQETSIPPVLDGKDLAGLAQTGTGKTAAYLIPLIQRVLRSKKRDVDSRQSFGEWTPANFVLVLVPTRELAEQVLESVDKLGASSGVRGVAIYGGTGYDKQKEGLRNRVEFVVATPGRLIDLYKDHSVDLKQVRAVVFDEADRMFDMGFKDDMNYVLQRIPKNRQFLVFSATLNFEVLNTAYQFGADPVEVNISRDKPKAENVVDEILHAGHEDKPQYLLSVLKKYSPKQVIIFSNFKHNVDRLSRFLVANNFPGLGISSLLTQVQRNRVLQDFKDTEAQGILVATDLAARGLDIQGVDMVINYDLPTDPENYVHRIGRTGRAGASGRAFSLVSDRDVEALQRIEEFLKHKLTVAWMEDSELVTDFSPLSFHSVEDDSRPSSGGYVRGRTSGGSSGRNARGGREPNARDANRDGNRSRRPPRTGTINSDGGPLPSERAGVVDNRESGVHQNPRPRNDKNQARPIGRQSQQGGRTNAPGGGPGPRTQGQQTSGYRPRKPGDAPHVSSAVKTQGNKYNNLGRPYKPGGHKLSPVVRRGHDNFWSRLTGFFKTIWSRRKSD